MLAINGESKHDVDWMLDTVCTFHICPNRDLFSIYETVSTCVVFIENNEPCQEDDIDIVRLKLVEGTVRTLD